MLLNSGLVQLAQALDAELLGADASFIGVSTDSRNIQRGDLFVALEGEHFDGHDFIEQVASRGACGAVVRKPQKCALAQIVVADTLHAFGQIAALNRDCFAGKVLALTGSAGKTTTKDMLATILSVEGQTLATQGNLNNEIGVPKTLLRLSAQDQFAVIEMGAARVGDIAYLAKIAKPDVALVTNAMPAHVEGFGSLENIGKGKGEIFSNLADGGVAVINVDDQFAPLWQQLSGGCRQLLFSARGNPAANVYAENIQLAAEGSQFVLNTEHGKLSICLQVPGQHNIANAVAASAAAIAAGASLNSIETALDSFTGSPGRMQRQCCAGSIILDDTYNANPGAMKSALQVLQSYGPGRVAVLGDMAELGSESITLHSDVASYARELGIEYLFTVGNQWQQALCTNTYATHFENKDALLAALLPHVKNNATILVKGSRSMKMETVVKALLASAACVEVSE